MPISPELSSRLDAAAPAIFGAGHEILSVDPMEDGHAGLTFGVRVRAGDAVSAYILKMGPAGVRRSGSTDIFRQARLLNALHAGELPVPSILFASPDDDMLGAPFVLMEFLKGRTFIVWEPHSSFSNEAQGVASLWLQAARALAQLHAFDWQAPLAGWDQPVTLAGEIARWAALLKHCEILQWRELAFDLQHRLERTMPAEKAVGLVHGDFQPGNILYDHGVFTGIVDWDLAMIGPQGIDVGWLMMMADRDAWAEGWKPTVPLDPTDILAAYSAAKGPATNHAEWYQAFAHFRMGAIAGLNLKLHRNGRRVDATWERFAPSIPPLLKRGIELVHDFSQHRKAV